MKIDLVEQVGAWLRRTDPDRAANPTLIENLAIEHVQTEILRVLMSSPLGTAAVFQGGTSLRKCYGNNRFSEDLDFAMSPAALARLGQESDALTLVEGFTGALRRHFQSRFGLEPEALRIKTPKDPGVILSDDGDVHVATWQLRMPVSARRRVMVKVEIATVPAYTKEMLRPLPVAGEIHGLAGDDFLVPTETRAEIFADKIVAIAGRDYLKARDLWDISWMSRTGVDPDIDLVARKFEDYGIVQWKDRIGARLDQMHQPETIEAYRQEMSRFTLSGSVSEEMARQDVEASIRAVEEAVGRLHQVIEPSSGADGPGF